MEIILLENSVTLGFCYVVGVIQFYFYSRDRMNKEELFASFNVPIGHSPGAVFLSDTK